MSFTINFVNNEIINEQEKFYQAFNYSESFTDTGQYIVEATVEDIDLYKTVAWISSSNYSFSGNYILLDPYYVITEQANYNYGNFKVSYRFFENQIGNVNPENQNFFIKISESGKEVKIKKLNNEVDTTEIHTFNTNFNLDKQASGTFNYVLNFGNNTTYTILNSFLSDEETLYLKLSQPILTIEDSDESDIRDNSSNFWVDKEIIPAIVINCTLQLDESELVNYIDLAGPNIRGVESISGNPTALESAEDLKDVGFLGINAEILKKELLTNWIDKDRFEPFKLNIDYTYYENFIHFSSAEKRLENFYKKVNNIQDNLQYIITGSVYSTASYENKIIDIINTFDNFEKFLYYETNKKYYDPEENIFQDFCFPKYDNEIINKNKIYTYTYPENYFSGSEHITGNYEMQYSGSFIIEKWYEIEKNRAILYDEKNQNNLINTIPVFIKYDSDNKNYLDFIAMIGQFFDSMKLYIEQLLDIYNIDNDVNIGLAKQLTTYMAKHIGINIYSNNNLVNSNNLYKYFYSSSLSEKSYINVDSSNSDYNTTIEIWRRLLNNFIDIYKRRGTKTAITELLNCYGIPQSVISIKEFGGPREYTYSNEEYILSDFNYYLDVSDNKTVIIPKNSNGYNSNCLEFRFNLQDKNSYNLITTRISGSTGSNFNVWCENTAEDQGIIYFGDEFNYTRTEEVRIYDSNIWNLFLQKENEGVTCYLNEYKFGMMISMATSSFITNTSSFEAIDDFVIGNYNGLVDEIKLWKEPLSYTERKNHTIFPRSEYHESSTNELYCRLTFNEPIKIGYDAAKYIMNSNTDFVQNIYFNYQYFEGYNEFPFAFIPSNSVSGNLTFNTNYWQTNKIRIHQYSNAENIIDLTPPGTGSKLDKYTYDLYSGGGKDTNRVFIGVASGDKENNEIYNFLDSKDIYIDDLIGDPGYQFSKSYPALDQIRNAISFIRNVVNFNDYFKFLKYYDNSLFKMFKTLLPARVREIVGILIESNILDRQKILYVRGIEAQDSTINEMSYSYGANIECKSNDVLLDTDYNREISSDIIFDDNNKIYYSPTIRGSRLYLKDNSYVYTQTYDPNDQGILSAIDEFHGSIGGNWFTGSINNCAITGASIITNFNFSGIIYPIKTCSGSITSSYFTGSRIGAGLFKGILTGSTNGINTGSFIGTATSSYFTGTFSGIFSGTFTGSGNGTASWAYDDTFWWFNGPLPVKGSGSLGDGYFNNMLTGSFIGNMTGTFSGTMLGTSSYNKSNSNINGKVSGNLYSQISGNLSGNFTGNYWYSQSSAFTGNLYNNGVFVSRASGSSGSFTGTYTLGGMTSSINADTYVNSCYCDSGLDCLSATGTFRHISNYLDEMYYQNTITTQSLYFYDWDY